MEITTHYSKKEVRPLWQRVVLLIVLAYEGAGCLLGGTLLVAAPDGRLMDMPVTLMNGAFPDFTIPGIILFLLGILNTFAFVAVVNKSASGWALAGLSMAALLTWFGVEIALLRQLHWLHIMWGGPVVIGALVVIPMIPSRQALQKALLLCGIFSSLLYAVMNVLVAMQWPGYSSASQTISELSAVDAPTRPLWNALGMVYTMLVFAFGWGILMKAGHIRSLRIVGMLTILSALIGLFWPPMHLRETLAAGGGTLTDTMHIVFSVVTVVLMFLMIGFAMTAFGKAFRVYSMYTALTMLVFGFLTFLDSPALQANKPTPWIGVWERVSIGAYFLWVIVLSIRIRKLDAASM